MDSGGQNVQSSNFWRRQEGRSPRCISCVIGMERLGLGPDPDWGTTCDPAREHSIKLSTLDNMFLFNPYGHYLAAGIPQQQVAVRLAHKDRKPSLLALWAICTKHDLEK